MEQSTKTRVSAAGIEPALLEAHAPRELSFRENVILTIKVFAIIGLAGAVIWGLNHWTSAKLAVGG